MKLFGNADKVAFFATGDFEEFAGTPILQTACYEY